MIYNLFPWITGLLGVEPKVILDFFLIRVRVMRQSLAVSLGYIAEMPFNFSLLDVHMWYLSADRALSLTSSDILGMGGEGLGTCQTMVSCSMGVTLLLPYYRVCRSVPLGTCSWNSFGMLYYFAGFNGYLLLGHYLRNHNWTAGSSGIGIPCLPLAMPHSLVSVV